MTVSFAVTIEHAEGRVLWCRCLNALAQVADEIRFTVSSRRVVVSSKNTAYTSFMDLEFDRAFFKAYEFHSDTVSEGLGEVDGEVIYTFSMRSRLLSVLFKRHEEDVETFKISLDASDSCPQSLRYKLQIEVFTKSFIRKRFSPFYTPCAPEIQKLSSYYKDKFLEQKAHHDENVEINYLMTSIATLKGFVDSAGPTEQLKLDINNNVFSVTAFTRGVSIKEREILKQPMAVNMSFKTDELHDLTLGGDENKLVFRLKEFKTFLNLAQSNECLECWFQDGGDPILFEISRHAVTMRLIQDTDNDVNIPRVDPTLRRPRARAQVERVQQFRMATNVDADVDVDVNVAINDTSPGTALVQPPLFVPNDEDEDADENENDYECNNVDENVNEGITDITEGNTMFNEDVVQNDEPMGLIPDNDSGPRVTWGDAAMENMTLKSLINTKQQVIQDARLQYIASIKRRKLEKQGTMLSAESQTTGLGPTQIEDQAIGPTQDVSKPRGIFD